MESCRLEVILLLLLIKLDKNQEIVSYDSRILSTSFQTEPRIRYLRSINCHIEPLAARSPRANFSPHDRLTVHHYSISRISPHALLFTDPCCGVRGPGSGVRSKIWQPHCHFSRTTQSRLGAKYAKYGTPVSTIISFRSL